jgi:hypothetical protein
MKIYKLKNIRLIVVLFFCLVSNIAIAQYNENGDPIVVEEVDVVPPPITVVISGQELIDTKINSQFTYTITSSNFNSAIMNTTNWTVGVTGVIISTTNNSIVVKWNDISNLDELNESVSYSGTTNTGTVVQGSFDVHIYTSTLIGATEIKIPESRIQTYSIDHANYFSYGINNNSWTIVKGTPISYGENSVTVQWDTAGTGTVKCDLVINSQNINYTKAINITSTLVNKEVMFVYDNSGNLTTINKPE